MPNQWRPISEAPKDGTPFLAYWDYHGRHEFAALRYDADRWDASGWRMLGCEDWVWQDEPTHFMFLPDPPNTED